ncbi:hypothetical protein BKA63DRAFT_6395 [Paraphoma chrysanthemicola]|nr:hypothetical protein BKA63DRAFT_6395 [Paraphoma chrysanthemicola]
MSNGGAKSTAAAPPRLSAAISGEPVSIKVSPGKKTYRVHKALLVHHSEYFRNALRNSWSEAKNGGVTLDDVEPGIFDIFVEWLYTGNTPDGFSSWIKAAGISAVGEGASFRLFGYSMATLMASVPETGFSHRVSGRRLCIAST